MARIFFAVLLVAALFHASSASPDVENGHRARALPSARYFQFFGRDPTDAAASSVGDMAPSAALEEEDVPFSTEGVFSDSSSIFRRTRGPSGSPRAVLSSTDSFLLGSSPGNPSREPKSTSTGAHKTTTSSEPKITRSPNPRSNTSSDPRSTKSSNPKISTPSEPKITRSPNPRSTKTPVPQGTMSSELEITRSPTLKSTKSSEPKITRSPTN